MKVKTFNISLPIELLELVDTQAKLCYETRSSYIRHAILDALKRSGAFTLLSEEDKQKIYREVKTNKLKQYLVNLELSNEDMR